MLPLRDLIVKFNLLRDALVSKLLILLNVGIQIGVQLVLLSLKLDIGVREGLVTSEDVVEFLELIRVLFLDLLEEGLKLLHLLDLVLDFLGTVEQLLFHKVPFLQLSLLLHNLIQLALAQLRVLLATHLMRLEECAELDKVILDEDVFLPELGLALLEVLFLLAELLLLILEGLLHLVHGAPLLEETCGRRYTIQL